MSNTADRITVVKIGGNVIDNPDALNRFLDLFASLPGKKILVHGGGKEATRLGNKLEIPVRMVDGRRITDDDTLKVVTMVYAGLINKRIVAALQARECNAIGLTGADGNTIPAIRRRPEPIDFGHVGDIDPTKINGALIESLLSDGITPVFCAIAHDSCGNLLNCNADSIASAVATACSRHATTDLIYCFEKPGVMTDVDDDTTVIACISPDNYEELRNSGAVTGGMIPKIDNALKSVENGVNSVTIKNAETLLEPGGTLITTSTKQ